MTLVRAEGPYFDELKVGQVFDRAPSYTLTSGRAAVHQSIVGDRLRLPLDDRLAHAVTGRSPLAHPALVWDVAIGQSTVVTHHVKANLFYRNLIFQRVPAIGDTLRTTTTVEALKQNARRDGRARTGLAALRMVTIDQDERPVLDFYRCAMLPLRHDVDTGHADDLDLVGRDGGELNAEASVHDWDLDAWRRQVPDGPEPAEGLCIEVVGGDVVSSAPELARLSLNVAQVHHDAEATDGLRLVYGGHTIGLAMSQATRAFPAMVTVLGWQDCLHLGPVHEGDTLRSSVTVEGLEPADSGGTVARLRSQVIAGEDARPVLDWRFVALLGAGQVTGK
ncbi:MAG: Acyl dehydratase-like protein [Aeromicrobium sp.]|nr:Acyl dehydratase-like protein [Aeromicrobium sp.]